MSELRLVPGALIVWAVTLALLLDVPVVPLLLVPLALLWFRQPGQAVLTGVLGTGAAVLVWWRRRLAAG